MKIAAVMCVRNAGLWAAASALHLLNRVGVDEVRIADNDSTDNTGAVLRKMAACHRHVFVIKAPGVFRPGEIVTELAHEAGRAGADWILPVDHDEFPSVSNGKNLKKALGSSDPRRNVFRLHGRNFVQFRGIRSAEAKHLRTVLFSASPIGSYDESMSLVCSGKIATVQARYGPKTLVRYHRQLEIIAGNHGANCWPEEPSELPCLRILHVPLGSFERLGSRQTDHAPRSMAFSADPGVSWHIKRLSDMDKNALAYEWSINSHVGGVVGPRKCRRLLRPDLRVALIYKNVAPELNKLSSVLSTDRGGNNR